MHKPAQKTKATKQTKFGKSTKPSRSFVGQSRSCDVHSILHLHRTIGNQAVLRLLQTATDNIDANSASRTSTGVSHDFSRILIYPGTRNTIQPKLKVNSSKDRYEKEADRIADEALRQKLPEEKDEKVEIQAIASQHAAGGEREVNEKIENWLCRSKGGGNPISDEERAFVEPRMKFDFSKVQVHTDNEATRMNQELGARAFTHGRDIYFGADQYNPQSIEGKRLLAHELAHVVQQNRHISHTTQPLVQRAIPTSPTKASAAPLSIQRDLTPPGNCIQGIHDQLQHAVKAWCDHPSGRTCTAADSCNRLQQKIRRNQLCAQHRRAINDQCYEGGDLGHRIAEHDARRAQANCMALYRVKCQQTPVPVPLPETQPERAPHRRAPQVDRSFLDRMAEITGLTGTALILYLIISEGSRLFPPRNLVPVP